MFSLLGISRDIIVIASMSGLQGYWCQYVPFDGDPQD